jgi:transposase
LDALLQQDERVCDSLPTYYHSNFVSHLFASTQNVVLQKHKNVWYVTEHRGGNVSDQGIKYAIPYRNMPKANIPCSARRHSDT